MAQRVSKQMTGEKQDSEDSATVGDEITGPEASLPDRKGLWIRNFYKSDSCIYSAASSFLRLGLNCILPYLRISDPSLSTPLPPPPPPSPLAVTRRIRDPLPVCDEAGQARLLLLVMRMVVHPV